MEQERKNNVSIFDADYLLYYATIGNKVLDEQGNPLRQDNKFIYTPREWYEVQQAADELITLALDKSNAEYYIGYLGNSPSFRYEIDAEYKGKRNQSKPEYFKELKEYLNYKWGFILLNNGLEADDAVNIARNMLKDTYNITIVTNDKDLIKCISGKYLNPRDFSIIRTSKEKATEAFWTSMITGDQIDGIKGLPRCGKSFAEKLFKDIDPKNYNEVVRQAYISKFGLHLGNEECMKSFKLLYILKEHNDILPILTKVERKEEVIEREGTDIYDSSGGLW